ncbi:UAA transporter [Tulasnella sp. UAMH 9824]|nr:UAA transporter [Tulasnella sp. UAMH 9824]
MQRWNLFFTNIFSHEDQTEGAHLVNQESREGSGIPQEDAALQLGAPPPYSSDGEKADAFDSRPLRLLLFPSNTSTPKTFGVSHACYDPSPSSSSFGNSPFYFDPRPKKPQPHPRITSAPDTRPHGRKGRSQLRDAYELEACLSFEWHSEGSTLHLANVKQVLTICLAVIIFDLHITPTNGMGISLTLLGGMWYGVIESQEKKAKSMFYLGIAQSGEKEKPTSV